MVGHLVVIDGPDGAGKGTQHRLALERLGTEGVPCVAVDFPRYGQPSAWFVEQYLAGNFGPLAMIGPRLASEYYAIDRYAARPKLEQALATGKLVVANRYVMSNMAHQGGKIPDSQERQAFFGWLDELEHGIYGIPRPSLNIVLDLDIAEAQSRVDTKDDRAHLEGRRRDIHEESLEHLQAAQAVYREITSLTAGTPASGQTNYVLVDASSTPAEVHRRIWRHIEPLV